MNSSSVPFTKLFDHALLRPDLDVAALEAGCRLAAELGVASVCIVPHFVARARELLEGSGVLTGTTVGFPHGSQSTRAKLAETEDALANGAEELDMVVNVGRVLSLDFEYVRAEIAGILDAAHARGVPVKVIFETGYLEERHKRALAELSAELGADWVKTSTGFGPGGATLSDVQLLRSAVPPSIGVKASGGIRRLDQVLELLPYVTRIGTSQTHAILEAYRERQANGSFEDARRS